MNIKISPVVGIIVGINYLDWGTDGYEDIGHRYELQLAIGLFIVSFTS